MFFLIISFSESVKGDRLRWIEYLMRLTRMKRKYKNVRLRVRDAEDDYNWLVE